MFISFVLFLKSFAFPDWINFFSGCFRQAFFYLRDKKNLLLVTLDRWSSYAVTIVWELGGLSIGCLRWVVTAGSKVILSKSQKYLFAEVVTVNLQHRYLLKDYLKSVPEVLKFWKSLGFRSWHVTPGTWSMCTWHLKPAHMMPGIWHYAIGTWHLHFEHGRSGHLTEVVVWRGSTVIL